MSLIRTVKAPNSYFQMDRQIVEDPELSWKAKGLMAYLMSKPNNWEVYQADLEKRSKDGRDSVKTGIKELLDAGYMQRQKIRDGNGKFIGYEYVVFEHRSLAENGKPVYGKPAPSKNNLITTTTNTHIDKVAVLSAENPSSRFLKSIGIRGRVVDELSVHEEDYLRGIYRVWKSKSKDIGLFIHMVRSGDEVQPDPNDPNKYTTGEFAKYVVN